MPKPDFPVSVRVNGDRITFQDRGGNTLGPLHVTDDSTITFAAAPGSDPFTFNYCYVSPNPIDPCPSPGATPANPAEFTVTPAQPFSETTFTLADADTDRVQTQYHYTVEVTANGAQKWGDPQIVNYPKPGKP